MKKEIEIIKTCPSCSSILERVRDQLFCRNSSCGATASKKIIHFAKAMKIKGLGEKTIEKLDITSIFDIYYLTIEDAEPIIGKKLATKLLDEINKSKTTTLDVYLPAFSITLIGNTAARRVAATGVPLEALDLKICKDAGLGDKASNNLLTWVGTEYKDFSLLPITIKYEKQAKVSSKDIKVCITGKLEDYKSRALAATYLESNGITVVSGVSKTLNYLINEDNKPSSKLSKANSYNIPVVTIKQLIEEINK